jgi:hypothetical protein
MRRERIRRRRPGPTGVGDSARHEEQPMDRKIFTEEHTAFRKMVRTFVEKVVPYHDLWEKDGQVSPMPVTLHGSAGHRLFDG